MNENISTAVEAIKTAILQSQLRAATAVNQEQLSLYYGIGRFVSINTRNKNWGSAMITAISQQLRSELPGLRGFGETNLKNMRLFYEAWKTIETNSSATTDELATTSPTNQIRQLQLTNLDNFPIVAFLSISFTHHIAIITNAKEINERLFYINLCAENKLSVDKLTTLIKQNLYYHQAALPNNFLNAIPDYKQAYCAMQMFKDEYLLDFINVEEIGMHEELIDERIIEQGIIHNIKKFILAFGKGFSFIGSQVHYDKLGHDHWIDLLFYNRDLRRLVLFELKNSAFKPAYLAQMSTYLRILNDQERKEGEEAPIGIILCKSADKAYVEYIMQDYLQPMGVATYKTSADMDEKLLKALPPKEKLQNLLNATQE